MNSAELIRVSGAALGVLGGLAFYSSWLLRKPGTRLKPDWNPRGWLPLWSQRDLYRRGGYLLLWLGWALVVVGGWLVFGAPLA